MKFFGSNRILGINSTPKTLSEWKDEQDKKAVLASQKAEVKTASKVENKKQEVKKASKVVFASTHEKVNDKKSHFPINDEHQAKCAVIRIMEAQKAPDWFNGTLDEAKNILLATVKQNYPNLKFSSSKSEVKKAAHGGLTPQQTMPAAVSPVGAPGQTVQATEDKTFAPGCGPECEGKGCKCVDDLCNCTGIKNVPGIPGENGKQQVQGYDMAMVGYAASDDKFVKTSKLTDKEKNWYKKYLEIYYPSDYAKAMVADY